MGASKYLVGQPPTEYCSVAYLLVDDLPMEYRPVEYDLTY